MQEQPRITGHALKEEIKYGQRVRNIVIKRAIAKLEQARAAFEQLLKGRQKRLAREKRTALSFAEIQ